MTDLTPLRRALDRLVDGELDEFVLSRRRQTPQKGWRAIAEDLMAERQIEVSHEALRQWYEPSKKAAS